MQELMTTPAVAEWTGLSQVTLRRWRIAGEGPRFVRLGRAVRYRREDIADFVERRTYSSTTQADVAEQTEAAK
jgi:excisionase family DNA binding protein